MATPLEQAIDQATADPILRRIMRLAALLEGGSLAGPWPSGDQGQSHGPFQIYTVAHPGVSAAQANDPGFAVAYMLPEFQAALEKVKHDHASWLTDSPMMAAAYAVFWAERPLVMYPYERIAAAWSTLTGTSAAGDVPPADPPTGGTTEPITNTTGRGVSLLDEIRIAIKEAITGTIRDLVAGYLTRDRVLTVVAVLIGATLLVAGLVAIASPAIGQAVKVVADA